LTKWFVVAYCAKIRQLCTFYNNKYSAETQAGSEKNLIKPVYIGNTAINSYYKKLS